MSVFNTFMRRATIGAAATVAALALPATAMAADAVASFDSTNNGAGGFTYGSTDGATYTPFSSNSNCVINNPNTTCLQRGTASSTGDFLPGAYRNSGGAFDFGSVNVPATSIVLHPGPETFGSTGVNLTSVYVAFTAAVAGVYSYTATFRAVDDTPTGVGISSFTLAGVTPLTSLTNSFGNTYTTSGSVTLGAGGVFGFIVDKGLGEYYNDSTSLAFSISAAPEPGTWAMMIVGFGVAGVALRRRKTMTVATA